MSMKNTCEFIFDYIANNLAVNWPAIYILFSGVTFKNNNVELVGRIYLFLIGNFLNFHFVARLTYVNYLYAAQDRSHIT